ncbi:MAG: glycine zipper domain-containing protein [Verrucomicrobium sp.]|nr:glycine zipper domain-containing protein [Verrucomicrobium sp.]
MNASTVVNFLVSRTPVLCAAATASVLMASCASGPNAQTGTVVGGLGGAAVGGIIGHQSGRGLEGAAIGGALGALGGNAIGNAQDQRNYAYGRGYYSDRGYYDRGYYDRGYNRPRYYY